MIKVLLLLIILIFTITPSLAEKHFIKVGHSLKLPTPANSKISISSKKFIKWTDLGSYMKVKGLAEGLTEVKTATNTYQIQTLNPKNYSLFKKYQKLLSNLKGLEVDFIDNTLLFKGNLYRYSDWKKLSVIAQKHQLYYLMNAKIDKDVKQKAITELHPLLFTYSQLMPELKLVPFPTIYRLKNSASEDFDHTFKSMGFRIKDHNQKNITKQIRLKLNFVELSRSSNFNFGASWLGAFQANILNNFKDLTSFDAFLNQSSDRGDVNIVYQTELICEINQECQFSEGGQIPIRTSSYNNNGYLGSVSWKEYGLVFKFNPSLLAGEKIKLKLQYDLSHLDSQGDGQIPAIKSKSLLTYVSTKNNTPIVVSGLESTVIRKSNDGPIPLTQIPLLNKILSSNTNNDSTTKMILIVTPTLVTESE